MHTPWLCGINGYQRCGAYAGFQKFLSRVIDKTMDLTCIDHWIFDMDGTLTVAVHDFEAIRVSLGLPPGKPILETLDGMSTQAAAPYRQKLDEIEFELARQATPAPGAGALLDSLCRRGKTLGILTRNGVEIAHETLRCCDLLRYFDTPNILGRETARPKPDPDGVIQLLEQWDAPSQRTVMVGDYYFDIAAGSAAGTVTVYFDPRGSGEWSSHADVTVNNHTELLSLSDEVS